MRSDTLTAAQRETLQRIADSDRAWTVSTADGSVHAYAEVDGKAHRLRTPTCRALYMRDLIDIGAVVLSGNPVIAMTVNEQGRRVLAGAGATTEGEQHG